jgi:uncharacterized iron-regulated membrane protein
VSTASADGSRGQRRWPAHQTVWRWHFYAGLICIPFVLWLAATGSIYLFKPQLDAWQDRPYSQLVVDGPPAPASSQVAAALAAVPGSELKAYQLPDDAHSAVQILVSRERSLQRVYVHPLTLQVLQVIDEDRRFTNLIFHLHGELLQGDRGSLVVETAASWALVMILTGLYLWWPSSKALAGVLYPRWRDGRIWWRDLHAVTGFWVSFFVLFLLISGLPWARSWGGMLKNVRHLAAGQIVRQDWTTGGAPADTSDEHATHRQHHHGAAGGMNILAQIDALLPLVQQASLVSPVLLSPPAAGSMQWHAHSETQNRPRRAELELDGASATVVSRQAFGQRPLFDRVVGTGIAAHEGQLFAPLNQLLGLLTAISLWAVCISALVMWWRRRPQRVLGAPPALPTLPAPARRPALARPLIVLIVLLAILLPMMGITLLLTVVAEKMLLRRWPAARDFLGLT